MSKIFKKNKNKIFNIICSGRVLKIQEHGLEDIFKVLGLGT